MSSDDSNVDWLDEGGDATAVSTPAPAPTLNDVDQAAGAGGEASWADPINDPIVGPTGPRPLSLKVFIGIQFITAFAALNMGIGQLVGIGYEDVGPIQYWLRLYVILACFIAVCNELEYFSWTKNATLLRYWVTRGMFYNFIGVLGLEENEVSPARTTVGLIGKAAALNYIKTVAWMILVMGLVYILMGAICLDKYKRKVIENYRGKSNEESTDSLKNNDELKINQGESA